MEGENVSLTMEAKMFVTPHLGNTHNAMLNISHVPAACLPLPHSVNGLVFKTIFVIIYADLTLIHCVILK